MTDKAVCFRCRRVLKEPENPQVFYLCPACHGAFLKGLNDGTVIEESTEVDEAIFDVLFEAAELSSRYVNARCLGMTQAGTPYFPEVFRQAHEETPITEWIDEMNKAILSMLGEPDYGRQEDPEELTQDDKELLAAMGIEWRGDER